MTEPLRADHTVEFSYRRGVGGATEQFLAGLRRGEIRGSQSAGGRVTVPPVDGESLVRVEATGEVRSWTWVDQPGPEHPLDRPFAFALIQLDRTASSLLHVVDVADEGRLEPGLRVRAAWRADRTGSVRDIRAFVPADAPSHPLSVPTVTAELDEPPEAIAVQTDLALRYTYEPGLTLSSFLSGLAERRIEGGRCVPCDQVYVPSRPRCPVCGRGPMTAVELGGTGRVVSYTVVHVPPYAASLEVPFAWAWIQLDGADVPFPHLLGDVALADISVGMPVQACWVADDELAATWASIRHFGPAAG